MQDAITALQDGNPRQPPRLSALTDARLARDPQSTAFIENGRAITHAQFHEQVLRSTTWLQQHGVRRGHRVAIWMVNRVEWLALYFALGRLGAAAVAVNTRYRSEEVGYLLAHSQAHRLILQQDCRGTDFGAILARIDSSQLHTLQEIDVIDAPADLPATLAAIPCAPFDPWRCDPAAGPDTSRPDDLSILYSTSGTTKGPKLVMHPQRTIAGHAMALAGFYRLDAPDARLLAALPFCGTFGMSGVLAAYAGGAPACIMDVFDAEAAAGLLRAEAITHAFGSDEMYRRILERVPQADPFPRARLFGFGAFNSSISDFASQACERGVPLTGLYGSSEVQALVSAQSMDLPIALRIQGGGMLAVAPADVRIRDLQTGRPAPAGVSGEIEIRTPYAFTGYYNDPDATAQVLLPDGYFRTGDAGHLREDGSFVYESRLGDAIRIGGFLVNPQEIEDVLKRAPGVADAQVVAVDIDGQPRPVAFVIARPGHKADADALIEAARASIASFKVPARVWFVDEYPVTSSANGVKTQRNRLRDMAGALLAAPPAAFTPGNAAPAAPSTPRPRESGRR
ncbi:AMP-binding protein [Bordetella petrii]|nr:AMP-binding protein [Bordetella petrii]